MATSNPHTRRNPYTHRHCKAAYRSGLEEANAKLLASFGITPVLYEQFTITYLIPSRETHYTPDFVLPNGIVIETKGRFLPEDRQKHILIKEQHPELDLRFVFSNSNAKLYKGSPTSYAQWCQKFGFKYADRHIPESWVREPKVPARVQAAKAALIPKTVPKKKE